MDSYIRSFLAVPIPNNVCKALLEQIDFLSKKVPRNIKWVSEENLHITLKFIGQFRKADVIKLKHCLHEPFANIHAFKITFNQFGSFPNLARPRVIWFGFDCPPPLEEVYSIAEECYHNLGYMPEQRKFSPHLTIGRVRRDASTQEVKELSRSLATLKSEFSIAFTASSVAFYESRLTSSGPVYTELFNIPLAI